ncbi:GntR family transcriptional regulator, partial [Bacillus paranthracis]|nr:GntR family transcriptional regulator [Bacillus paranthracis]MED1683980.1 GntR family transcriptional regulator [Bacillus paranthracis]
MKIVLSNVSSLPLYQQIKEQIKESIFNNELKEGEQLPSIRSLANDLHVSVLTTKRVYAELETEGFIIT